jgi:hypothetical protein
MIQKYPRSSDRLLTTSLLAGLIGLSTIGCSKATISSPPTSSPPTAIATTSATEKPASIAISNAPVASNETVKPQPSSNTVPVNSEPENAATPIATTEVTPAPLTGRQETQSETSQTSSAGADNWEYQGKASTGEDVTLNLDRVAVAPRSMGRERQPSYLFTYRIGRDVVFAFTDCNGEYSASTNRVSSDDNFVKPNSPATRSMLDRVCNHRVKTAQIIAPPSNVRIGGPKERILCTLSSKTTITTYGQYNYGYDGDWIYTDACGKLGIIHSSQIR